ncbi:Cadherin-8 [Varanus komodoensis]|nr:Cadherin-8 [Varanus komodoensis]
MEYTVRKARQEESQIRIKISGRNINNLRYAGDTTPMAESEEELKSLLMQVKEESAKAGLKLNIKNTKITATGSITTWQIDGEEMEETPASPLDRKAIKPVSPRGDQPWLIFRRPDPEDEAQILWPPNEKEGLPGEECNAGNNRRQEKKGTTENEVAGWTIIKTALSNMDREAKEEYTVVIQAKDMGGHMGGLSGTTTVTITLTDVNDNPPKFAQSLYHFSVLEDIAIGEPVGRVKANDLDTGENAKSSYDIIEGDGMNIFEITPDSQTQEGIIRLRKPLDFEFKRSYTLKLEATNVHIDPRFISVGPFKDTATVKIVVEDADEPPVFSSPTYLLEVHENAAINSVIGQVTAHDPDVTSSSIRLDMESP